MTTPTLISKPLKVTSPRCSPVKKRCYGRSMMRLLKLGMALGRDVKVCPCKTIIPLYRRHVFAQIKPSANLRIDLGLALEDTLTPERLIDTGGLAKKDRMTHRIAIAGSDRY